MHLIVMIFKHLPLNFILPIVSILFFWGSDTLAQQVRTDSLLNHYLKEDSIALAEIQSDSSSILDFIDSLINMDFSYSSLSGRIAYISNITNAGRDFGVKEYGLSTGISYYHKTGFYGDISGFWNSDTRPRFNPMITSAGFMLSSIPKLSVTASYDHYFYFNGSDSLGSYNPFTNSLNLSPYLDLKFISIGVDYSFLFGSESAHRIRPDIYGNISFRHLGFIDQLQFLPGVSVYFGNQNVVTQSLNYAKLSKFIQAIGLARFRLLYKKYGSGLYQYIVKQEVNNEFGLMNYNFSLPVNLYVKNFTLSLSYFYNIPVALPNENIDETPNSYFSASLIYSVPFTKKLTGKKRGL